jgi:16S rRNA (guanine966-N2)-methyltransferase
MRIISGEYRGRQLPGKLPGGIRPTLDAVRESIFNMLINYIDLSEATVADICAGSGAQGWEALSRGAKKVYFVEKSRQAVNFLKRSQSLLKVPKEKCEILNMDAVKAVSVLKASQGQFDFIFTDPPYDSPFLNLLIEQVAETNLLAPDGFFCVETGKDETIEIPEQFKLFKEKKFGGSKVFWLENA